MKQCHKCHMAKELSLFSKDSGNKDGLYSWCKECVSIHHKINRPRMKANNLLWKKNNLIKVKEYQKNYDKLHQKEKLLKKQLHRRNNPDLHKERQLRRIHKIGLQDYNLLFNKQNGVCAVCNSIETLKHHRSQVTLDLAVDHDHKTGKIRGLLCSKCNKGIGVFSDSLDLLNKAISYLKAANV